MIVTDYIFGGRVYWRCTPDGRIQFSEDGKRWRIARQFRGKRVDMRTHTVTDVEKRIATKLDDPDKTYGVQVV